MRYHFYFSLKLILKTLKKQVIDIAKGRKMRKYGKTYKATCSDTEETEKDAENDHDLSAQWDFSFLFSLCIIFVIVIINKETAPCEITLVIRSFQMSQRKIPLKSRRSW